MGGCCCCCSSKAGAELNNAPTSYYYPRASEEHVPLSFHHSVTGSALSPGIIVDTNLNISDPDAYRPPPAPVPFDVDLGRPQSPQQVQDTRGVKNDELLQTRNSVPETAGKHEDVKGSDCKLQTDLGIDLVKGLEVELPKSVEPFVSGTGVEDECPICLEEYDAENPKLSTKCEHHFHLACVLEWMERKDTCPVCDKEMIIDPPIDY